MWRGWTPPAPPGCTRFSPGIRFPTFRVFSLQRSRGGGRRSMPEALFGYLGFRGLMHGAVTHRLCHHRAVTRMWGPSVIR